MNQKKDWLKLKSYPHLSPKIEDKHFIRSYVKNEEKVAKHRFYPLLHYTITERRFRRENKENPIGEYVKTKKRKLKLKCREIFYSNHLDAQIYAYYAKLLNDCLDKVYEKNKALNESVIAYRAIPFNENRNKCNIDFAKEVFDYIRDYDENDLVVFCFDVSSFFDTLDHRILKKAWYELLGRRNLPPHHYNVYKAITHFAYLDEIDLFKAFPELNIKGHKYIRLKDIDTFCQSPEVFRDKISLKGLVKSNKEKTSLGKYVWKKFGIPQGTPLSAALSNVYMLDFDKQMVALAKKFDGFYRRYSDDIVFACPKRLSQIIPYVLKHKITKDLKLNIQDKKTQKVVFHRNNYSQKWDVYTEENGRIIHNKPLAYLGFEFDGTTARLRNKGVSKYYRTLKRAIRRRAFYAKVTKSRKVKMNDSSINAWIFRKGIFKRHSHLGAKRKKIDGRVFWGNYYSYVLNANKIMGGNAIKRQLRNHWLVIEKEIKKFESEYELERSPSRRKLASSSKKPLFQICQFSYPKKLWEIFIHFLRRMMSKLNR
ncbi:MAG: reverse transcriptase domain-containing protein [Bacteroidetes bacterium]|nr:reverse transcriptase domain-containing protein [Bacteroidota bacterium]